MSQCPSPAAAQASAPLHFHRPLAAIDSSAAEQLFELPFLDLLYRAQTVHRQHHRANEVQLSSLLSIKTGGCAEDCGYCSQSAHHKEAGVPAGKLMGVDEVVQAAQAARDQGATRFCMGAAWRNPKQRDMTALTEMVSQVRALGLETCMTLGMLEQAQAEALKQAGLDYYNHNLDTAPDFYGQVISTRSYQDRLDTLQRVQEAGLNVCCGGIIGMGETRAQRAGLIAQLASLPVPPQSVPINHLVPIAGTPLQDVAPLDEFEFVRTVAVARIALPHAVIRLSAGRESMSEATQALCFAAGANSIFLGAKLLTTANAPVSADLDLLQRLGLQAAAAAA
ncbi:biotin synthase BioB [Herbaspirillum sp.]|jgi:biotin synthase|uniref:biotin synthase BioB n=1 Tax=Herbaspirillum TaxID=963 RepID=UPI002584EED2|nr:biotin synthase BioB [Herbaspirillum sp.]MCP3653779.1 biotin synthase BioB [Herbaspirillum sp.]MCP3947843.1 biotin synthase BioB [Herbaspirillum sp.]MCP4032660.1 biotin synthase BioB [Herbaspirillum sp.]MCP4555736.1 biotin synthase BioB [Herbaspirillum sp.]